MKKFLKLFLLSFIALCLIGCPNPNESVPEDPFAEEKRSIYKEFIGTWEIISYEDSKNYPFEKVIIKEDSIVLGKTSISFNPLNMIIISNGRNSDFSATLNGNKYSFSLRTTKDNKRVLYIDGYVFHNSEDLKELKQEVYNYFIGSWELASYEFYQINNYFSFEEVTFKKDCIIFGDEEVAFNPLDITLERWEGDSKCFTTWLNGTHYEMNYNTTVKELSIGDIENHPEGAFYIGFFKVENGSDNTGNESSALDFSVVGDWKYKINGTINTVLSLNEDGSFTFTIGTGSNYTGTYSLSGNKITFEYEASTAYNTINIKDTFTVSGNENEITLSLVESVSVVNGQELTNTSMSSMLNHFYSIVNSTSITLTK